jgi:hypothetical protein
MCVCVCVCVHEVSEWNPFEQQIYTKNVKGQECTKALFESNNGRGGRMERTKEEMWVLYLIYLYENKRMKPAEIVLRGGKGIWENGGGDESNQVHCKHVWKCHNETLLHN